MTLYPRRREVDNSLLTETVTFTVTFSFMIFCWVEQHPMHLASIPTPGVPSQSEGAGNRHYNSMAHVQLGFVVHIRFHQADVFVPDLSGRRDHFPAVFTVSSGKKDHEDTGLWQHPECTHHFTARTGISPLPYWAPKSTFALTHHSPTPGGHASHCLGTNLIFFNSHNDY